MPVERRDGVGRKEHQSTNGALQLGERRGELFGVVAEPLEVESVGEELPVPVSTTARGHRLSFELVKSSLIRASESSIDPIFPVVPGEDRDGPPSHSEMSIEADYRHAICAHGVSWRRER